MRLASYNFGSVNPFISNRIVFLLACVGLGLTLFIGIAHTSGVGVPCGEHPEGILSGCDKVANDEWSRVLDIPVAFLGSLMYFAVACLAFLREVIGIPNSPRMRFFIWMILGAGTVVAGMMFGRTYYVINALCVWCTASHILTFCCFAVQTVDLATAKREPLGRPVRRVAWFAFPIAILFFALAGAAPAFVLTYKQKTARKGGRFQNATDAQLYRDYNPVRGNPNAKLVIIEFADMHCQVCAHWNAYLDKKLAEGLESKVKVVFRNFPIASRHPHATTAALFGEYARRHGKFWEFLQMNFDHVEDISQEKLVGFLDKLGLNSSEALGLLDNKTELADYLKNVQQDMADGWKLGVRQTPWWFIQYPNGELEYAIGDGIDARIESDKFQRALQESVPR